MQSTKPTSGNWTPDLFNGAGIQREPGKDRTDDLRRAGQEMRDSGSSDLFDIVDPLTGQQISKDDPRTIADPAARRAAAAQAQAAFEQRSATYRHPLTCAECGCFLSKHDPTCSQWQEVTVEANVVTFHRPAGGWPTLAELIERSIALGGDPFGQQSDDVEYGPRCLFCRNRAAVCRCDS